MMNPPIGKYLILIGAGILILGVLFHFFHDKLTWLGNLPGDIRVEKENFQFYFPITTMILLSVAASVAFRLLRKYF